MKNEDILDIKGILKILERAKFDGITMVSQMENVKILHKFSEAISRLENSLNPIKDSRPKNEIKPAKSGKK